MFIDNEALYSLVIYIIDFGLPAEIIDVRVEYLEIAKVHKIWQNLYR